MSPTTLVDLAREYNVIAMLLFAFILATCIAVNIREILRDNKK